MDLHLYSLDKSCDMLDTYLLQNLHNILLDKCVNTDHSLNNIRSYTKYNLLNLYTIRKVIDIVDMYLLYHHHKNP